MVVLGFVWLALLGVELTRGLSPALKTAGTVIWVIFIADFALRVLLAPEKWAYIRRNWITAISLLGPAVRVFRVARLVACCGWGGRFAGCGFCAFLPRSTAGCGRSGKRWGVAVSVTPRC